MVPVLDKNKKPLMPCSEKRARKLMERGEAKPYWCKGVFCIILQKDPSDNQLQDICVGIDPGSKFEGFSVKSETHTLLNIQTEAKTDVKKKVESRAALRRNRRGRKTRNRKCRYNRSVANFLAPSTKSRWEYKLNLVKFISKLFPISHVAVEDIKAKTKKGAKKWNKNFSPIEVGKNWFYSQIEELGHVLYKYSGFETYQMRQYYGFKKNSKKDKKCFYTHCVDAWCLANEVIGGGLEVKNERVIFLKPLKKYRRQLHVQNQTKCGVRKNHGSTRSLGIERGTLVRHSKWGFTLVGGSSKDRISLHNLISNKRVCQNAKLEDLKILTNIRRSIEY